MTYTESPPLHRHPAAEPETAPAGGARMPGRRQLRLAAALTVLAAAVWIWSLGSIDPAAMNALGLVSVVGARFIVALVLVMAAFGLALGHPERARALVAGQLVLLVAMLYATPALVEDEGRFHIAYLHAGFMEYIGAHGGTLPELDARFSWTGFFALGAAVSEVAGLDDPVSLIRFAPVFFELLYLAPLWAIAAWATPDLRVRYLAIVLFYVFDWVGQNYLAPQALAMFLLLAFVAILLRWFGRTRDPAAALFAGPPRIGPDAMRIGALALLLVVYTALVVSHQLTPVALGIAVAGLAVARLTSVPTLPIAMGCIFLAWLSFAAEPYWSGHLDTILGGGRGVGGNVGANISGRISGDETRRQVLDVRMAMTGVLMALALVSCLPRIRRGMRHLPIGLLAAAPFPIVLVQGYGGEALLRAYLYAAPFLAILAAATIVRAISTVMVPRAWCGVLAPPLAVAAVCFVVAAYGNEQFEAVPAGELAAVRYVYDHAPPGSMLAAASENVPWRYRDLESYAYLPVTDEMVSQPAVLLRALASRPQGWFVESRSQGIYGEQIKGLPPGWLERLVRRLEATGQVRRVYANDVAAVYRYVGPRS